MSYRGSAPPLQIELHRSQLLTVCLLLLLVTALTAICLTDVGNLLRLLIALPVIAGVVHALRYHAWRVAGNALVRLTWSAAGVWTATTRDGRVLDLQLAPDSYWHARILVLNFTAGGKKYSVMLLPDMLPGNVFRRLRVRLRLEGGGEVIPA